MNGEEIFIRCMVGLAVLTIVLLGATVLLLFKAWVLLVVPIAVLCFAVGTVFARRWDL